jgi:hypothetical protein
MLARRLQSVNPSLSQEQGCGTTIQARTANASTHDLFAG